MDTLKTRTCRTCKKQLINSDFYPPSKNGKYLKQPLDCKLCYNNYNKDWRIRAQKNKKKNEVRYTETQIERRKRFKTKAIELLGGCCSNCKQKFPDYVYDFHHIDPTKKERSPSYAFFKSWEYVLTEVVAKCVLLCANCHRLVHYQQKEGEIYWHSKLPESLLIGQNLSEQQQEVKSNFSMPTEDQANQSLEPTEKDLIGIPVHGH